VHPEARLQVHPCVTCVFVCVRVHLCVYACVFVCVCVRVRVCTNVFKLQGCQHHKDQGWPEAFAISGAYAVILAGILHLDGHTRRVRLWPLLLFQVLAIPRNFTTRWLPRWFECLVILNASKLCTCYLIARDGEDTNIQALSCRLHDF